MKLKGVILIFQIVVLSIYAFGDDLPLGVPNPIGQDGKQHPKATMFATKAYQDEALKLMLNEANLIARELSLKEKMPIEETNLVEKFIVPFGYAHIKKAIGTITTEEYVYCISHGNKFSYLIRRHQNEDCQKYQAQYTWPISRMDTNQAYQMATQWLAMISVDVKGLNRDCNVIVESDHDYIKSAPGNFVPVYDVYWQKNGQEGRVASVRFFAPTKTILQLSVENPQYVLRQPLVFTNLAQLLSPTNASAKSFGLTKAENSTIHQPDFITPTNLMRIINDANRVVVTNKFSSQSHQYQNIILTGQDARKVIQAVSLARQYPNTLPSDSEWDWRLQFYKDENLLAAIDFQGNTFLSNGEFHDETGTLKKLEQKVLNQGE